MPPLILAALAPLLKDMAANGLNLIGNAVMAKGKDVIEEKLGVKLEDSMATQEGRQKLLQLQNDHEEFLLQNALENRHVDLEFYKVDMDNTASARDMNRGIQESDQASTLAKNLPYFLDAAIIGLTFVLIWMLFLKTVPPSNKEMMYMALGACLTWCGTILNFHRGTSAGSQRNGDTLRTIAKERATS